MLNQIIVFKYQKSIESCELGREVGEILDRKEEELVRHCGATYRVGCH